ncbi:daptide-type RiPP biosynthesis aminotransferase [Frankia sp. Cppng1_Ct_nod]|uniref:daptide-type RiPP biosynthesis aminotransferase n=1 Tax=Frankia sp. Cppng1_Ct_nod TaxID=2897162 RepID=UPI001A949FFD|nr:daptide-type RiPP biosynthesis aminotransferase [Frankia sp. Cppng1_Ct_nod]
MTPPRAMPPDPAWGIRERPPLWELLTPPSRFADPSRTAVAASGIHLFMADGRRLLCGTSRLWNVNFGYGRPELRDAVAAALDKASYLTLFRYGNEPAVRAARALLDATDSGIFGSVIFSTSGSAANDLTMKLVRQWSRLRGQRTRKVVVGLRGSYHGLTYGAHGLTGEDLDQDLYGVDRRLLRHVDPHDPAALTDLCEREGDRICAIVIEPVLGTGAIEVPTAFIDEAGRLADEHGFLVVADEVATGFYRTGPFVASSLWTRRPDVLLLSKGLTNGTCAAAAVLVSHQICEVFERHDAVFVHGETQAGTPPTAAAIETVLDLAAWARESAAPVHVAGWLDASLHGLVSAAPSRLTLTGRGCFRGVVVRDQYDQLLDPGQIAALVGYVREAGAVVHPGLGGVQLVPALVYEADGIRQLTAALSAGLDRLWDTSDRPGKVLSTHDKVGQPTAPASV